MALDYRHPNPLSYVIWATIIHSLIFVAGVLGNIVLIVVVRRTKSLQSSTYCYLVSLAFADLLVLFSAVPEAIVAHHIGFQWVTGQAGCSMMVFTNFLGINAGSLSILGFTIDRYIAARKPLLILRCCTWQFARKVICCMWVFAIMYCVPWFFLTEVRPSQTQPEIQRCQMRLSPEQYRYFFITDIVLFYVIPLLVAVIVFFQLGMTLRRSIKGFNSMPLDPAETAEISVYQTEDAVTSCEREVLSNRTDSIYKESPRPSYTHQLSAEVGPAKKQGSHYRYQKLVRARMRVFRTLVTIVILFAITWLPYRGLLIYNSFATKPWLNICYLFFAKSCIYFNCAMNPYLYNFMSRRFRYAVFSTLCSSQTQSTTPNS